MIFSFFTPPFSCGGLELIETLFISIPVTQHAVQTTSARALPGLRMFGVFLSLSWRERTQVFKIMCSFHKCFMRPGWVRWYVKKKDFTASFGHSTITLVGRGREVEQLIHGVIVGLNGVDVLVVGVVRVHHHTQLAAWEKSNATQVRRSQTSKLRQRAGSEQSVQYSLDTNICTCLDVLRDTQYKHKWSPLFFWIENHPPFRGLQR